MLPKLELQHVSYSYHSLQGETLALSDLTLQVMPGEFLAVVGPSGCGKSTLLSLLSGLLRPDTGTIRIDGQPLSEAPSLPGYMLQKDCLLEWRDLLSNVSLGLEIRGLRTRSSNDRLLQMLDAYGLSGFEHARPSQLSGGMRQRAALIRTLAPGPDLLLLDEPFSALDYQTRLSVCDDISRILREQEQTAILVTHDLSEAISIADRILILTPRPGRIRSILSIPFPDQCREPLKRRNFPEFSHYFHLVWKELKRDDPDDSFTDRS